MREVLRARGVSFIDLSIGEPSAAPPATLLEALVEHSRVAGQNRYPPHRGSLEFRAALARYYERRNAVSFDPDQEILPLLGSKEGIILAAMTFADADKPVYVRSVDYPTYRAAARLAGAPLIELEGDWEDGYTPRFPRGAPRSGGVVFLSSPCNPTGAVLDEANVRRLVGECEERGLVLAFDAAYLELHGAGPRPALPLRLFPQAQHVVELHSFSKCLRVPSWRVGFAAGPRTLIGPMSHMKSVMSCGVPVPIQAALTSVLGQCHSDIEQGRSLIAEQQRAFREALHDLPIEMFPTKASLFCWTRFEAARGQDVCAAALEQGLMLLPGTSFGSGGDRCVRMSTGVPPEELPEIRARLSRVIERLERAVTR